MLLVIFLSLSAIVGIILITCALVFIIIIKIDNSNGISWAMALFLLQMGLAFFGVPLTILRPEILPAGIMALVTLIATIFYFIYKLYDDRQRNPSQT